MRTIVFVILAAIILTACTKTVQEPACERPELGFAYYPGVVISDDVARYVASYADSADLMLLHFGDSVPWETLRVCGALEACEELPEDLRNAIAGHIALLSALADRADEFDGTVYLSLSPLNNERDGVATNVYEEFNLGYVPPGNDFNNSEIRELYLLYVSEMVRILRPDLISQGVEVNMYVFSHSSDAANLISLLRDAKASIVSPVRVVGPSIQWEYWRKDWTAENQALASLEQALPTLGEGMAISSYPQLFNSEQNVNASYYDFASYGLTTRTPLYISETGAQSDLQEELITTLSQLPGIKGIVWYFFEDADGYFSSVPDVYPYIVFKNMGLIDDAAKLPHPGYPVWQEIYERCN